MIIVSSFSSLLLYDCFLIIIFFLPNPSVPILIKILQNTYEQSTIKLEKLVLENRLT